MGRMGGSYQTQKNGKKKVLERTKDAKPVSDATTRIKAQRSAQEPTVPSGKE